MGKHKNTVIKKSIPYGQSCCELKMYLNYLKQSRGPHIENPALCLFVKSNGFQITPLLPLSGAALLLSPFRTLLSHLYTPVGTMFEASSLGLSSSGLKNSNNGKFSEEFFWNTRQRQTCGREYGSLGIPEPSILTGKDESGQVNMFW